MTEITCNTLGRACGFAKKAHKGQMYGDDEYYNGHLVKVAREYEKKFGDDLLGLVLCFLHDVVEDTDTELEAIEEVFGEEVMGYVWDLTRQKEQSYQDYLQYLAYDEVTAKVKWADSYVNLMKCIETGQFSRGKKYMDNLEYLNRVIESGGE